eukprot:9347043-Pyramimonas_sp.AAC.1
MCVSAPWHAPPRLARRGGPNTETYSLCAAVPEILHASATSHLQSTLIHSLKGCLRQPCMQEICYSYAVVVRMYCELYPRCVVTDMCGKCCCGFRFIKSLGIALDLGILLGSSTLRSRERKLKHRPDSFVINNVDGKVDCVLHRCAMNVYVG